VVEEGLRESEEGEAEGGGGGIENAAPGGTPLSTLRKKTSQLEWTFDGSIFHNRYISSAYTEFVPERNDSEGSGGARFVLVVESTRRRVEEEMRVEGRRG